MKRLILSFLLIGCGFDTDLSVYADSSLEEPTRGAIKAWNDALSRGPCYGVHMYIVMDVDDSDIQVVWGDAYGWAAYTEHRRCEINPAYKYPRWPLYMTTSVAHELGHALGAVDLFDERSKGDLMWWAPPVTRGPEPTGYDVAQVCSYVFQN